MSQAVVEEQRPSRAPEVSTDPASKDRSVSRPKALFDKLMGKSETAVKDEPTETPTVAEAVTDHVEKTKEHVKATAKKNRVSQIFERFRTPSSSKVTEAPVTEGTSAPAAEEAAAPAVPAIVADDIATTSADKTIPEPPVADAPAAVEEPKAEEPKTEEAVADKHADTKAADDKTSRRRSFFDALGFTKNKAHELPSTAEDAPAAATTATEGDAKAVEESAPAVPAATTEAKSTPPRKFLANLMKPKKSATDTSATSPVTADAPTEETPAVAAPAASEADVKAEDTPKSEKPSIIKRLQRTLTSKKGKTPTDTAETEEAQAIKEEHAAPAGDAAKAESAAATAAEPSVPAAASSEVPPVPETTAAPVTEAAVEPTEAVSTTLPTTTPVVATTA